MQQKPKKQDLQSSDSTQPNLTKQEALTKSKRAAKNKRYRLNKKKKALASKGITPVNDVILSNYDLLLKMYYSLSIGYANGDYVADLYYLGGMLIHTDLISHQGIKVQESPATDKMNKFSFDWDSTYDYLNKASIGEIVVNRYSASLHFADKEYKCSTCWTKTTEGWLQSKRELIEE